MIIVTGMDNSGKTTLAKQLGEELNLPVVHSAGPELSKGEKQKWTLEQIAHDNVIPSSIIHDRFMPLEEMVYGPILRGHSDFRFQDHYMELLYNTGTLIIYTRPSREVILEENGREQMEGVMANGEKLLAAWDDLAFQLISTGWNVLVYNWETSNIDQVLKAIENAIEEDY